jgi:hypothetical protein
VKLSDPLASIALRRTVRGVGSRPYDIIFGSELSINGNIYNSLEKLCSTSGWKLLTAFRKVNMLRSESIWLRESTPGQG